MISALIPAYNESDRIAATIAALIAIDDPERIGEIIVVDDGSVDGTAEIAERAGADTVLRQPNRGKGAALDAAVALASGDVLLLIDADLGDTAREASRLLRPVIHGAADMTIAAFEPKQAAGAKGGGIGLVVRLARWGIRRMGGRTMSSPLSGQRALRREALDEVGGFAAGWGVEVALTICALRAGLRVLEVPTAMSHRVTGRTPGAIMHRAAQFMAVARTLWRLRKSGIQAPVATSELPHE